jgi:hypothetical protein
MHVPRPIPNFSINILPLSTVMKAALPACGILNLLANLKIDMIYGVQERMVINSLDYSFKEVRLSQGGLPIVMSGIDDNKWGFDTWRYPETLE